MITKLSWTFRKKFYFDIKTRTRAKRVIGQPRASVTDPLQEKHPILSDSAALEASSFIIRLNRLFST